MLSYQCAFFQNTGGHRRISRMENAFGFYLLPPGDLVSLSLWGDDLLLRPGAGQSGGGLSGLAGDVPVPAFFQKDHPPLACRRTGQMAGNLGADTVPGDD